MSRHALPRALICALVCLLLTVLAVVLWLGPDERSGAAGPAGRASRGSETPDEPPAALSAAREPLAASSASKAAPSAARALALTASAPTGVLVAELDAHAILPWVRSVGFLSLSSGWTAPHPGAQPGTWSAGLQDAEDAGCFLVELEASGWLIGPAKRPGDRPDWTPPAPATIDVAVPRAGSDDESAQASVTIAELSLEEDEWVACDELRISWQELDEALIARDVPRLQSLLLRDPYRGRREFYNLLAGALPEAGEAAGPPGSRLVRHRVWGACAIRYRAEVPGLSVEYDPDPRRYGMSLRGETVHNPGRALPNNASSPVEVVPGAELFFRPRYSSTASLILDLGPFAERDGLSVSLMQRRTTLEGAKPTGLLFERHIDASGERTLTLSDVGPGPRILNAVVEVSQPGATLREVHLAAAAIELPPGEELHHRLDLDSASRVEIALQFEDEQGQSFELDPGIPAGELSLTSLSPDPGASFVHADFEFATGQCFTFVGLPSIPFSFQWQTTPDSRSHLPEQLARRGLESAPDSRVVSTRCEAGGEQRLVLTHPTRRIDMGERVCLPVRGLEVVGVDSVQARLSVSAVAPNGRWERVEDAELTDALDVCFTDRGEARYFVVSLGLPGAEYGGLFDPGREADAIRDEELQLYPMEDVPIGEVVDAAVFEPGVFGIVVRRSGSGGPGRFFNNGRVWELTDTISLPRGACEVNLGHGWIDRGR